MSMVNGFPKLLYQSAMDDPLQDVGPVYINSDDFEIAALHEFAGEGGSSATCGGEVETTCFDSTHLRKIEGREELKKRRFIWTDELHELFVHAFHTLEKAVPKKILEFMRNHGVQNITRAIVASHLQKYRLHLKRYDLEIDKSFKDDDLSSWPSSDIQKEALKREEHPQPVMEALGQASNLQSDMLYFNCHQTQEHVFDPNPWSNQLANDVFSYNNTCVDMENNVMHDHLYLKLLREYEETYITSRPMHI